MCIRQALLGAGIVALSSMLTVTPVLALNLNPIRAVKNIAKTTGRVVEGGAKTAVKVVRTSAAIPLLAAGGALTTKGRLEKMVGMNSGSLSSGRKLTKTGETVMGGKMVGDDPRPRTVTGTTQASLSTQRPIQRTGKPIARTGRSGVATVAR